MATRILAINPGSTSTKIALFDDDKEVFGKNLSHSKEELAQFKEIIDQKDYRREMVEKAMAENGYAFEDVEYILPRA